MSLGAYIVLFKPILQAKYEPNFHLITALHFNNKFCFNQDQECKIWVGNFWIFDD